MSTVYPQSYSEELALQPETCIVMLNDAMFRVEKRAFYDRLADAESLGDYIPLTEWIENYGEYVKVEAYLNV